MNKFRKEILISILVGVFVYSILSVYKQLQYYSDKADRAYQDAYDMNAELRNCQLENIIKQRIILE